MEIFIILVIVLICIYSIKSYMKKLQSGCCGGESDEKRVRVRDKNPSHYPYEVNMTIKGMTCSHCKLRVENALNSLEGVWAKVDLDKGIALIRMKSEISEEMLERAVKDAGYQVGETAEK